MRLSAFRLFVFLLAWCVGFQSTALASGMRCAHGQAAKMELGQAMPAGMHHAGMAMQMNDPHPPAHQHHHMGGDAPTSLDHPAKVTKFGCECGCNCATVGCVGVGPGIAAMTSSGVSLAAPAAFVLQDAPPGLRAAHGLDLIRPPSKS